MKVFLQGISRTLQIIKYTRHIDNVKVVGLSLNVSGSVHSLTYAGPPIKKPLQLRSERSDSIFVCTSILQLKFIGNCG